ncbi:hypothetical protein DFH08DRAFT_806311 [Mycena albidolilacea]|uniref:Uncharacterized protein n=1 Tax=Mycena albidolilacea TaxID=1033008 RepID=A0AAD7EVM9_9AGAR|nr:hypothetical protein DFH08DRAFT_806311 [Mycena albidolilacea]
MSPKPIQPPTLPPFGGRETPTEKYATPTESNTHSSVERSTPSGEARHITMLFASICGPHRNEGVNIKAQLNGSSKSGGLRGCTARIRKNPILHKCGHRMHALVRNIPERPQWWQLALVGSHQRWPRESMGNPSELMDEGSGSYSISQNDLQVTKILGDLQIEVREDHVIKRLLVGFVGSRTSTSASSSTTLHDPKSIKTKEKDVKALVKVRPVDLSKIRDSGQDIDKCRSDRWCHMNSNEDEEDGSPRKQRGSKGKIRGL